MRGKERTIFYYQDKVMEGIRIPKPPQKKKVLHRITFVFMFIKILTKTSLHPHIPHRGHHHQYHYHQGYNQHHAPPPRTTVQRAG